LFEAGNQVRFRMPNRWHRGVGLTNADSQEEITKMLGSKTSVMITPSSL
jgi:hypothetical protein